MPHRLGGIRREEIDGVRRDPHMTPMGVERRLNRQLAQQGQWLTLDGGLQVYRIAIQSDGVAAIRVQFSSFSVGNGQVWLYSTDHSKVIGPYTGTGIDGTGEFWSNTLHADTAVVEYQPGDSSGSVPFEIAKAALISTDVPVTVPFGCQLDVSCYSDWSQTSSGVATYTFHKDGAVFYCNGALVNNTNNDFTPYFLTSSACISDDATAKTMEVTWLQQSGSCNGVPPDRNTAPTTLGASYLAGAPVTSGGYSLLKLKSLPNANLAFYGWDSAPDALGIGNAAIGVHYSAYSQSIAFGVRDPDSDRQFGADLAPGNLYYQVHYTSGRVDTGSQGSPLFTQNKRIVGTLAGGTVSSQVGGVCKIEPFVAVYSRFSSAYPDLARYLAPNSPPADSGLNPGAGSGSNSPAVVIVSPASVNWSWVVANPSQAAPEFINVTTTSSGTTTLSIAADEPWIGLSASTLPISQTTPGILRMWLEPTALTKPGINTGTVTFTTSSGDKQSIPVTLNAIATGLVPSLDTKVTMFPLVAGPGYASSFTLTNPYSTPTTGFVSFTALDGSPLIVEPAEYYVVSSLSSGAQVPVQGYPVTLEEVVIPARGSRTISLATPAPMRQGIAIVWTDDASKLLQSSAGINDGPIAAAVSVPLPFTMPFDTASRSSTTVNIFNPAWWGSQTLVLTQYDSAGNTIGTDQLAVPAQQARTIMVSETSALLGGKTGTLHIGGAGTVVVMALQTTSDGRIASINPSASK
jgi:hypothetical protein